MAQASLAIREPPGPFPARFLMGNAHNIYSANLFRSFPGLPPDGSARYPRPVVSFRIVLDHQTLRFAAAHFTTSAGECEPLHGHNYALTVEIDGDLTADAWVLDFSEAKALVRSICSELDHKFLLPLANRSLAIAASDDEFEVRFGDRRYVIPRSDVAELPVDNSTAERLAEYIARRIVDALRERGASNVTSIAVGVEEAPGQSGWFRATLP